mmetsp:Transcript_4477/g.10514  ORF Transcript_4477/g.10514 Transcript_4477/m.10514 type:complete len:259 (+) Transcript_4477:277-1053(+)
MQDAYLLLVLNGQRKGVEQLVALAIYLEERHKVRFPPKDDVHGSALVDAPASQEVPRGHHESQEPAEGEDLQLHVTRVLFPLQQLLIHDLVHAHPIRVAPEPARLAPGERVYVGKEQQFGVGQQVWPLAPPSTLEDRRGILAVAGVHAADHPPHALSPATEPGKHRADGHETVDDLVAPLLLLAVKLDLIGHLGILGNACVQQHRCLPNALVQRLILLEDLPRVLANGEGELPNIVHCWPSLEPRLNEFAQQLAVIVQ